MISITQLIIILFVFTLVIGIGVTIGLVIRNFVIKNNKLKEIVENQDKYLTHMYDTIKMTEAKIREIDSQQIFQSDDEIGFFFSAIKDIQSQLSEYIKYIK